MRKKTIFARLFPCYAICDSFKVYIVHASIKRGMGETLVTRIFSNGLNIFIIYVS